MTKQLVAIQSGEFRHHAVPHSSELVSFFVHPNCWAIVLLTKESLLCWGRGSTIGFFNPTIPTGFFVNTAIPMFLSANPDTELHGADYIVNFSPVRGLEFCCGSSKIHTFENALQSGDIWKGPILLVWTTKTWSENNCLQIMVCRMRITVWQSDFAANNILLTHA